MLVDDPPFFDEYFDFVRKNFPRFVSRKHVSRVKPPFFPPFTTDDRSTIGMRPIGSRNYESRNPIAVGNHGDKPAAVKDL